MLKQFVNLSKEKFETIFCKKFVFDKEDSFRLKKQDAYDNVVDDLRGMNISDKPYRLAVKRRHDEIKIINYLILQKYIVLMKNWRKKQIQ